MIKEGFVISICPTCGSPAIKKVCGTWTGTHQGETYTVKGLEYYSCPNCHEKVYSPEAMRKIQQASPAYASQTARQVKRVAAGR
jgi:YgiT-type zinc finger domain-containing protein